MTWRPPEDRALRAWLEYVAEAALDAAHQAIAWLDDLDAAAEDLEDDAETEDREAA